MQAGAEVSIIILNLNQAALTLNCVDAVIQHNCGRLCEIIVVDNGSAAADTQALIGASNGRFKLIQLNRNLFFGEANNIGVENAIGDNVLFLNNDVQVTGDWLNQLLIVLDSEYCAGAVGPRFLYADGKLQEAGAYIRPDAWTFQLGKGGMKLPRYYVDSTQVVDYCSAACLLMRKNNFLNLGGFDPIFDPAYFEDADLAMRLRSCGLFTYYCGKASVYHLAEATSRREWTTEQRSRFVSANHDSFAKRWGDYLKRRVREDCEPDVLPCVKWEPETRSSGLETVLLYSATPLVASDTSRRLLEVASALRELFQVIIAIDESYSRCRIYSLCREFGVELGLFSMRRISEVDQSKCAAIVVFGKDVPADDISSPHAVFEGSGHKLLQIVENVK